MHVPTHEEVLRTIDAFLVRHPAIGAARFGRDATGEPGLVARLRKGSTPTLKVLGRIKAFMDAKDAELGCGADHDGGDTAHASGQSCGSAEEVSAEGIQGFAAEVLGSDVAAAEGEGVSTLPGGPCA